MVGLFVSFESPPATGGRVLRVQNNGDVPGGTSFGWRCRRNADAEVESIDYAAPLAFNTTFADGRPLGAGVGGAQYGDTDLGPFRAIRVGALREMRMRDDDFGWTIEMQLKAKTLGLRVEEVPVRYRKRIGKSKITGTVTGTVRAGFKILSWIAGWRLRLLLPGSGSPRSR